MSKQPTPVEAVKFPVGDERYRNTHEGGMFVTLAVYETGGPGLGEPFAVIVEGEVRVAEVWKGPDDQKDYYGLFLESGLYGSPDPKRRSLLSGDVPAFAQDDFEPTSLPLVAAVTLGRTNWSGWYSDAGDSRYWHCRWTDLTQEGLRLVKALRDMYPEAVIALQTWLDT